MRDSMRYVNHLNEEIKFGEGNITISENNFRDYAWKYSTLYSQISSFKKDIQTKTLPVIISGSDYKQNANNLFQIIEKDVLANKPGRMYVGDYYLTGFLYGNVKKTYTSTNIIELSLNFVTDKGFWVKEVTTTYRISGGSEGLTGGKGYPYDYPYGYLSTANAKTITNTSVNDSEFILTIYGAVSSPSFSIAGNVYGVNTDLLTGEYLTIDTKNKTIIKTSSRGEKTNLFSLRDRENGYIFKPIPSGQYSVIASTNCNYDITLLMERSEPVWI